MMKIPALGLVLIISCSLFIATTTADTGNAWFQTISRGNKNIVKLHFYVHDVRTGPNATLYRVANSSITDTTSTTSFGQINVFDDKVTAEPDINSEEVARVQGTTTSADLRVRAFTMNLNFFITSGKFNGSTVSVAGRNQFADAQRELPVVGGTGAFRLSSGYAITSTYSQDDATNYSVFEYTIYVVSKL